MPGINPVYKKIGVENTIDVVMNPASGSLDQVVVSALGIRHDEKSLGYAVSGISRQYNTRLTKPK